MIYSLRRIRIRTVRSDPAPETIKLSNLNFPEGLSEFKKKHYHGIKKNHPTWTLNVL